MINSLKDSSLQRILNVVTLGNSELGDVELVNVHVFSIAGKKKQCVEEFHCMLTRGEDG